MKKIVLTFGLISGAIISAMMLVALAFQDSIGFDRGEIIGYTSMVLAFLLIFFGVRSYRDNVAGGTVRFGRALAVGALISVVASVFYVATWEVIYYKLEPDFGAKYAAYEVEKARADGATEEAIAAKKAQMEKFAEMYKNPLHQCSVNLSRAAAGGTCRGACVGWCAEPAEENRRCGWWIGGKRDRLKLTTEAATWRWRTFRETRAPTATRRACRRRADTAPRVHRCWRKGRTSGLATEP